MVMHKVYIFEQSNISVLRSSEDTFLKVDWRFSSHITLAHLQSLALIPAVVIDCEYDSVVSFSIAVEVESGSNNVNWCIHSNFLVSARLNLSSLYWFLFLKM